MSTVEHRVTPTYVMPQEDPEVVAERETQVAESLAAARRSRPVRLAIDERGRFKPPSEEERAAQLAGLAALWERLDSINDETDTEESWAEFERNLDEERRSAGMRTLFEGRR